MTWTQAPVCSEDRSSEEKPSSPDAINSPEQWVQNTRESVSPAPLEEKETRNMRSQFVPEVFVAKDGGLEESQEQFPQKWKFSYLLTTVLVERIVVVS